MIRRRRLGNGWPSIDLIPVTPNEARLRMGWFKAMVKVGDSKAGLLAKALKSEKAWPYLWAVFKETLAAKDEGG